MSNDIEKSDRNKVNKNHVIITKSVCVRNEYQNLKIGWIYICMYSLTFQKYQIFDYNPEAPK